jgi:tetratricopeptide (TPR) repeat protein
MANAAVDVPASPAPSQSKAKFSGDPSQMWDSLPASLEEAQSALEKGKSLGEVRGITDEEYRALYGIACRLCDDGDFQRALPLALQLVTHHGANAHYSFLAGTCLQRVGCPKSAAQMFVHSMLVGGDNAAACYRAGECFASLGEKDHAIEAFEAAFDLGRESADLRAIQELAGNRLALLRQGK